MSPELIMIHGGQPNTPRWCQRTGWSYGVQFGYTAYDRPIMTDFVSGKWNDYLTFLDLHRPKLALVADYRQREEWSWIEPRLSDVAQRGISPVVVAKWSGALEVIPEFAGDQIVRIGVSTPTSHMNDGHLPTKEEFAKHSHQPRAIHLLGGHPDQWLYLMHYYAGTAIVSTIDGNAQYEQARQYGKFWSRYGGYRDMRGRGYSTGALVMASMINARRYLERGHWTTTSRVVACQQQLGTVPIQRALCLT